ncbi:putative zinc-binding protein [Azorhizobium doebereinerae]|uniref:putative zinc-binding protein n=1 Tax=Azorhizobium doebereinerae TaxID=281091 RepID=UPI000418F23E|nr:putative zinc-binding protein [Azorhizobium doebereinerae]
MATDKRTFPLAYSCSGCSSAAQMANYVALCLDRAGDAEMSCIAGVGGDVPSLVRIATSGRPVVAIDGCQLRCVRQSLARHGVTPAVDVVLTDLGVKKRFHAEFDEDEAVRVYRSTVAALQALRPGTAGSGERQDR